MRKLILALLLLPLSVLAGTANLTWVGPTQNTDGSSITGTITYKVYRGLTGQAKTLLASPAGSGTTYTDLAAPVGTVCYAVTATVGTQESLQSAEACKVVAPPVPNAPTGLTVTVQTVYNILKQSDRYVAIPVGTVPADTACIATEGTIAAGQTYYAVPRSAVQWTGTSRPVVVVAKCG